MTTQIIDDVVFEIEGDGDAVLCIHGLGGSSNTWTPVMPALAGFKVIRPDMPGSARTGFAAGTLSIDSLVVAMDSLLNALDVQAVHVVAHSLGTIVAQHFALRYPARVRSLALFGPFLAPPEAGRAGILARAALARTGDAGMQDIADAVVKAATSQETKAGQPAVLTLVRESVMRQPPEGYAQSCEALAAAQPAAVDGIGVPTLLVTGDQDGVASPANVAAMAERMPGARHVVLQGCGHWHTFEKPANCAQELELFYAELR